MPKQPPTAALLRSIKADISIILPQTSPATKLLPDTREKANTTAREARPAAAQYTLKASTARTKKPASGKSTAISPATAPKERLMPTAAQSISKPAPIVTDRREPASLQPRLTATLPTTLSKRLQPTPQPKPRPAAQSR